MIQTNTEALAFEGGVGGHIAGRSDGMVSLFAGSERGDVAVLMLRVEPRSLGALGALQAETDRFPGAFDFLQLGLNLLRRL